MSFQCRSWGLRSPHPPRQSVFTLIPIFNMPCSAARCCSSDGAPPIA